MEKPSIRTQRSRMHLNVLGLKYMMKTYRHIDCESDCGDTLTSLSLKVEGV